MGAPKQKWTPEEESALRAGVEKYGAGKWRAIQKDPKFAPILKSRSNVDLKDKWRNLSSGHPDRPGSRGSKAAAAAAAAASAAAGPAAVLRKPVVETETAPLPLDVAPFPEAPYLGFREPPAALKLPPERGPLGSRYDDYILEAIGVLKNPSGSNLGVIATYVEEHYDVPHNFRKFLNSKLKSLTLQGKLIKVDQQNYKLNPGASSKRKQENDDDKLGSRRLDMLAKRPRMDLDHAQKIVREAEEAAALAAKAVAEAEVAAFVAEQAAKEAEIAEAESEQAEAAADSLLIAARAPRKSMRPMPTVGGAFAVTV